MPYPIALYLLIGSVPILAFILILLRIAGVLERGQLSRVVAAFILVDGLTLLFYLAFSWLR